MCLLDTLFDSAVIVALITLTGTLLIVWLRHVLDRRKFFAGRRRASSHAA